MPTSITTSESGEKGARQLTVEYDFGDTIADSLKLFEEKVVHSIFTAQAKVRLQALVRGMMKAGKTDKDIIAAVKDWVPSLVKPGKSPLEKTTDLWDKMSPEEKKAFLASIKK